MYTEIDFKTKKALKIAVAEGKQIGVYQPGGLFPSQMDGDVVIEGPHYPKPHAWWAQARIADGVIVKGTVK